MDVKKDGEMVLTTHTDGAIRITDRAAGQVIKAFAHIGNSENYLVPCAFTQDLKIVVGGNHGEIDVYDIDDGFVNQFQGRDSQIVSLITHPRCKDVIATTDQNSIKIMRI